MNNWAMLSVGVIIDEGEIKGVAAVAAGWTLFLQTSSSEKSRERYKTICSRMEQAVAADALAKSPHPGLVAA
jgi:hypothetical protein